MVVVAVGIVQVLLAACSPKGKEKSTLASVLKQKLIHLSLSHKRGRGGGGGVSYILTVPLDDGCPMPCPSWG